jgi:hypothetical protein
MSPFGAPVVINSWDEWLLSAHQWAESSHSCCEMAARALPNWTLGYEAGISLGLMPGGTGVFMVAGRDWLGVRWGLAVNRTGKG